MTALLNYTGATWTKDEDVVTVYIPENYKHLQSKFNESIEELKTSLGARKVRFSIGEPNNIIENISLEPTKNAVLIETDFSKIPHYETFALDFETSGVDALTCEVYAYAITDCETLTTHYVDLRNIPRGMDALVEYVKGRRVVVHNASYEKKILDRFGADSSTYEIIDTMILVYTENSSAKKGLKEQAKSRYGISMVSFKELTNNGKISYLDVPIDKAASYCGDDTYVTAKLYNDLYEKADSRLLNLDHRCAMACIELEKSGIQVDRPRLEKLGNTIAALIDKIENRIYLLAGRELNLNSPKQLNELVYGTLGVPTKKYTYTKTGGLSTSEDVINQLVVDGVKQPILQLLLKYREYNKILGTYIKPILKLTEGGKRLYTSLNYCGTETYRFSSSSPNLQNLPASGVGKEVRKCLIAGGQREGY
jgi:DNA polymerase-1